MSQQFEGVPGGSEPDNGYDAFPVREIATRMKTSIFVDGNSRRDFHPQVKSQQAMLARIDASILRVPMGLKVLLPSCLKVLCAAALSSRRED